MELNKLINEFRNLSTYSMDDICDSIIKGDYTDFIRKSDAIDILCRYIHEACEKEKVKIELNLTQTSLELMRSRIEADLSNIAARHSFQNRELYI